MSSLALFSWAASEAAARVGDTTVLLEPLFVCFLWTRDGEWGKREEEEEARLRRGERECEEEKETREGEDGEEEEDETAAGGRETRVVEEEQSEWDAAERERAIVVTDGGETGGRREVDLEMCRKVRGCFATWMCLKSLTQLLTG